MACGRWALALLAAGVGAAGVGEECEMMAVASDMGRDNASEAMNIFLSRAPDRKDLIATTDVQGVSEDLSARFGGFWDVFIMGPKFSYSVYCRKYVQLSTSRIEVLLCKESDQSLDPKGVECADGGLVLSTNDTIVPSDDGFAKYDNLRLNLRKMDDAEFEAVRLAVLSANFASTSAVAASIRERIDREVGGGLWNVIVENEKVANVQGFYYDYWRQTCLETPDHRWVVYVFDRRCFKRGKRLSWLLGS